MHAVPDPCHDRRSRSSSPSCPRSRSPGRGRARTGSRRADGGRAVYAPGDHEDHPIRRWPDAHVVELDQLAGTGRSGPDDAVALRGGCRWAARHRRDGHGRCRGTGRILDLVGRRCLVDRASRASGGGRVRRHRRARRPVRDDGARAVELDRRRDLGAGRQRTARPSDGRRSRRGRRGSSSSCAMGAARSRRSGARRAGRPGSPRPVQRVVSGFCPIDIAATSSRIIAIGTDCGNYVASSRPRLDLGPDLGRGACSRGTPVGRRGSPPAGDVRQLRFRPVPADRLELGPVRDLGVVHARRAHVAPPEHDGGFEGVRP